VTAALQPTTAALARTGGVEVRLSVPGDWWLLDLDHRTRHRSIAALVDARLSGTAGDRSDDPGVRRLRGDLVALLRRTARDAEQAGAVLCASLSHAEGDEGLGANLLVVVRSLVAEPDGLLAAARARPAGRGADVRPVGLPAAGPAVRLRGIRRERLPGAGRDVEVLSVQYVVPVPGSDATVVLTMTSPSLAYVEPLEELFDALAGTLYAGTEMTGEEQ